VAAGPGKDSLIFDTGPLETFAFADEPAWSALWSGFGSRMHRTDAVVDEIARKIRRHETFLEKVTIGLWPAAPIDLSDDESQHTIDTLRERLRREGDSPMKHVGEAATILAARRCGGIAVIDDFDGASLARAEAVRVVRTRDLLKNLLRGGRLSCADGWSTWRRMRSHSRLPEIDRSDLCPPACGLHRL
jgi:hypothetical protein